MDRRTLEKATELFDSIVGQLVFYGRAYLDSIRDFKRIKKKENSCTSSSR